MKATANVGFRFAQRQPTKAILYAETRHYFWVAMGFSRNDLADGTDGDGSGWICLC
jgi:hypothetical protein